MARHKRAKAIYPANRDDLLRRAYRLREQVCAAMFAIDPRSEDYGTALALVEALCEFARRISGGETDFARMAASTPFGAPQPWVGAKDEAGADIDEVIALCGGNPRLAIRSLLVMTEFLEAEADAREQYA